MASREERRTQKVTVTTCDVCGSEAVPFSNRVRACPICKKDVCARCAIVTDHWNLADGEFYCDYPDHYCKDCWKTGAEARQAIQGCRDAEIQLWDKWRGLCPIKKR